MAEIRVVQDWTPVRFLPFIQYRSFRAFLSVDPRIPLDLVPSWNEYRWTRPTPSKARQTEEARS